MKKIGRVLILIIFSFLLFSCEIFIRTSSSENNNQNSENKDDSLITVTFTNKSDFGVNVFKNINPDAGGGLLLFVPAGESCSIDMLPSSPDSADVFYFQYIISIGEIEFPYFCYEKSKGQIISTTKNNVLYIDEINSFLSECSYLVLENKSTSRFYVRKEKENSAASPILTPMQQSEYSVDLDTTAVYRIGNADEQLNCENASSLGICLGGNMENILLLPVTNFTLGNIYTFVVTNEGCFLKSVTPFNLETSKQIWSLEDDDFLSSSALLRSAHKVSDGSLIMGTVIDKNGKYADIKLNKLDKYGRKVSSYTEQFSPINNSETIKTSRVLEFAQQENGEIVMLLENEYLNKVQFIVCYNFETKEKVWEYVFPDSMLFRSDCKNKLVSVEDGIVAVAGGLYKEEKLHRYFAILKEGKLEKEYISSDYASKADEIETLFTSCWYDIFEKAFYVCGYVNCDFKYEQSEHKGIVSRFSFDVSEPSGNSELKSESVCEFENVLFFCIDGLQGKTGECGKWYVCGESCVNGANQKNLKGCFYSSEIMKSDTGKNTPEKYHTKINKDNCCFTQLCCYENKIVVAGIASDDFAGIENPIPLIVAFDCNNCNVLWENTSFKDYRDICGLIPNEINTYVVQLRPRSGEDGLYYVSADLLGQEKK